MKPVDQENNAPANNNDTLDSLCDDWAESLRGLTVPEEEGVEERVRVRKWLDCSSCFHTIKKPGPDGARIEIERLVDDDEAVRLLSRIDASKRTVRKTRYCFVWKDQYFEADVFGGAHKGLFLLERERTDANDRTVLPPFIDMIRDVTNEKAYKNASLASASA